MFLKTGKKQCSYLFPDLKQLGLGSVLKGK